MRTMKAGRFPGCVFATALVGVCLAAATRPGTAGEVPGDAGWSTGAPRDEIRPEFACESGDGPGHQAVLVIRPGQRDGLNGYFPKTSPATGARHYRFDARYETKGVDAPRRSVVAEIH